MEYIVDEFPGRASTNCHLNVAPDKPVSEAGFLALSDDIEQHKPWPKLHRQLSWINIGATRHRAIPSLAPPVREQLREV
jgi:hypothetical protein